MDEYFKEAIESFGEDITRTALTPAKRDLFEEEEKSVRLDDA